MDKFTVRNSVGEVDVAASAKAYAEALTTWVSKNETSSDTLSVAVNAVFDRFPCRRVPMPALLSLAVAELGVDISQNAVMTARLHNFVKGQQAVGAVLVYKGKNGGVIRAADEAKNSES